MTDKPVTVYDVVNLALQNNPEQLATAFSDVIGAKINAIVDQKREEIAQSLMADEEETTDPEDTDDSDLDLDKLGIDLDVDLENDDDDDQPTDDQDNEEKPKK